MGACSVRAGRFGLCRALRGAVCAAVVLGCAASSALAQITTLQLVHFNEYRQTASNAFTNLGADLRPFVLVQNANNISQSIVEAPNEDLLELATFGGGAYTGSFGIFSTQTALMSAYGAGSYIFNWSGGTLPPSSLTVNQPFAAGIWPSIFPRFTVATYNGVAGMAPDQPFTFELVNAFTQHPQAQQVFGGFFVSTVQPNQLPGSIVYSQLVSGPGATISSRVLPANTLAPNTAYYVTWVFANAVETDPPVIGNTRVEFRVTTRLLFTTGSAGPICDPIDFNRDTFTPDSGDLDDFIAVLSGGPTACSTFPTPGCNDVDFNNDGFSPDSLDLEAFISRLGGGPCL